MPAGQGRSREWDSAELVTEPTPISRKQPVIWKECVPSVPRSLYFPRKSGNLDLYVKFFEF